MKRNRYKILFLSILLFFNIEGVVPAINPINKVIVYT